MRYHIELIGDGEDAKYYVCADGGERIAMSCNGEQDAIDVCEALNEADDSTLVLNAMVKKSADTIEALGLSVVVDRGSLKSDEAWCGFDILAGEIRRLRAENKRLSDLVTATWASVKIDK